MRRLHRQQRKGPRDALTTVDSRHHRDPSRRGRPLTPDDWTSDAEQLLNFYLDVDNDIGDREAALNDPRVPDRFVLRLVETLTGDLRHGCLARCERPAVLQHFAKCGDSQDRSIVAFNPATPAASLRELAGDPDPQVRGQVVYNLRADVDVLAWLMADPSRCVREAAEQAFGSSFGHQLRQGLRVVDVDVDVDVDDDA